MTRNTVVSIMSHSPVSIGGIETFARELSTQLAQRGWRSVFVYGARPPEKVRSFLGILDSNLEVVERCGAFTWRALRATAKLLSTHRPAIVHLHFVQCPRAYAWFAKLYAADKVFMTDHISRPVGWQPRRAPLWKMMIGRILGTPIMKVFCVSSFIHRCSMDRGMFNPAQLAVVYNGVDIARAEIGLARREEFRAKHSIPEDRIVVLQAGWLIPQKGPDCLLRAAKQVLAMNDRVHFVLAGEGPQRRDLEQLTRELGIASHVTFTGRIEDPLGEGLYVASDLVCQVSRWEEAFGLTIAEAMASGKPMIATRVGAIPELVRDGETGYLVERGDCDALASRILDLTADCRMRDSMGRAGSEACRSAFDLRRNVATLIRHYGIA